MASLVVSCLVRGWLARLHLASFHLIRDELRQAMATREPRAIQSALASTAAKVKPPFSLYAEKQLAQKLLAKLEEEQELLTSIQDLQRLLASSASSSSGSSPASASSSSKRHGKGSKSRRGGGGAGSTGNNRAAAKYYEEIEAVLNKADELDLAELYQDRTDITDALLEFEESIAAVRELIQVKKELAAGVETGE